MNLLSGEIKVHTFPQFINEEAKDDDAFKKQLAEFERFSCLVNYATKTNMDFVMFSGEPSKENLGRYMHK